MPEKSLKSKSMRNPPIRVGGTPPCANKKRHRRAPPYGPPEKAKVIISQMAGPSFSNGHKKTCGHKPTGFNSLCFNRRLLSYGSFSSSRVGSNSGAVSYSAVSSNAIYNSAIHSGRVNSLGVSGLVATRSERNSCESYEHEN